MFALDTVQERLDIAKEFGAVPINGADQENALKVIKEGTEGRGVDCALEAVGAQATIKLAFDIIRMGGKVAVLCLLCMVCCAVLCCAVLCCAVLCCAVRACLHASQKTHEAALHLLLTHYLRSHKQAKHFPISNPFCTLATCILPA